MDGSHDTTFYETDESKYFEINDCRRPEHYKGYDPDVKELILKPNIRRCLDLSKAHISGGTNDGMTENVVIIEFQHCYKFSKDPSQCATKE